MDLSHTTPLLALFLAGSLSAQSNAVPGMDVQVYNIGSVADYGRRGAPFPNGEAGFVIGHSFCNAGSVHIPWEDQGPGGTMVDTYPRIAFLLARESDGRMVQISGRSYLKHSGTPFNFSSGPCAPCQSGPSATMRIGCSDTYGPGFNGNRNNLGPPDEINPWLGTWDTVGSYFDRGDPSVGGAAAGDNLKSLNFSMTSSFDAIKNRVVVRESELNVPGAQFYGQVQLAVQGEPGDNRANNRVTRPMGIVFNGTDWSASLEGTAVQDSILSQWSGATTDRARNGNDDGHFLVAVKVVGPIAGMWHYEYAVHNQDNHRGGATLRIPLAAGATVANVGFHDVDGDASNDWTFSQASTEIQFAAAAGNALDWNNIYNFWFDCSEPPSAGSVSIDQARPGTGQFTVAVNGQIPSGIPTATVTSVGSGCGDCSNADYEFFGSPAGFDLANSSMTLDFDGTNYTVRAGQGSFLPAAGTMLSLSDDDDVVQPLPFSLAYPGGMTNAIVICSNGFVSPGFGNGTAFTPTVTGFLNGPLPRWAGLWHDLNPNNGGDVFVDSSPAGVTVTFSNILSFSGGGVHSFQFQFLPSGTVHILWNSITTSGNAYLVGWSPGGGASDPGGRDYSTDLATPRTLCAFDQAGLALGASAAPVLGTTISIDTAGIPVGTSFGATLIWFQLAMPAIDLSVINMPGCELHGLGPSVDIGFVNPGPIESLPLSIPSDQSLDGVSFVTQTFTFSPPLTPLGVISSNGLVMFIAPQ